MNRAGAGRGIQLDRLLAGETHASVVCFLAMTHDGREAVKIGTSSRLKARVAGIRYTATLADVLLIVPGGRDVESAWHHHFRDQRIRPFRELFWLEGGLRDYLTFPPPLPLVVTSTVLVPYTGPLSLASAYITPVGPPSTMGLTEAVHRRVLRTTCGAARMDRARDTGNFPKPVAEGKRGELLYSTADLAAYDASKRGPRGIVTDNQREHAS
jgi:hypothetical protein